MNYSRYLSAVAAALRDTVQPEVQNGRAQDIVGACIRTLAGIAEDLEACPHDVLDAAAALSLPPEIRAGLAMQTSVVAPPATRAPQEDLSVRVETLPLTSAAAQWLQTANWMQSTEARNTAKDLLTWSHQLRRSAVTKMEATERGPAQAVSAATPHVADISAAALEAYLCQRFAPEPIRVVDFRFLTGGRVRQTAAFGVEGASSLPTKMVIQREHPGGITTFKGLGMQFHLLERMNAAGMKAPRPILLETGADALGAAFMIVERLSGSPPIASMDYFGLPPKSTAIAVSLAEQMAILHRQPVQASREHLAYSLNRDAGESWASDVEALAQSWKTNGHAPSVAVSAALAWMKANADCIDGQEVIVHSDMLLHNLLVTDDKVTAVLDWEIAHIGHPAEDLGYVRPVIEQMTDWSTFMSAYEAAGGAKVAQRQVDFFALRSILKLSVIIFQARAAFEHGHTSDPNMAEVGASFLPKLIDRLSTQLLSILAC